jgi:uncharacterized protein YoxC
MDITITLKDLILFLLGIGGIVLLIYLIVLVKNLVATLKKTNRVLDDVAVVSDIAAKRANDLDGIVEDVTASVGAISKNLKGNQGIVKTISAVVSLLTSLKGLFGSEKAKKAAAEAAAAAKEAETKTKKKSK